MSARVCHDCECEWFVIRKAPPWRERLLDGRLGPWYGPMSQNEYAGQLKRFRQSIAGGGLMDPDEQRLMNPSAATREAKRIAARYDSANMERYVARHSHEIPTRELEAFVLFYRDQRSYGEIARQWGTTRGTVENTLQNLRRRMHARY